MQTNSAWVWLGETLARFLHLPVWVGPPLGAFLGAVVALLTIMGLVTYMIWWLRKIVGWMQSRLGPKHVGWHGLMQTPADALKLMSKEGITPTLADKALFTIAPGIVFVAAYLIYVTIPLTPNIYIADLNVGVVYVSAVASMTVLGIVLGAWASNNKYALVAAFRSAAQMVSYEVPFAFAILGPVALAGSFGFLDIVQGPNGQNGGQFLRELRGPAIPSALDWFFFTQPIVLFCFFIAGLAENNVTPFDIVEAESEIVAGFHVEYSGMKFALFFLAEFANTMTLAVLTTLAFFGGWASPVNDPFFVNLLGGPNSLGANAWHLAWFCFKTGCLITVVFWLRATLPRVRVDQLMDLGWKLLIPVTIVNIAVTGACILMSVPRAGLAAINWVVFLGVLALGAQKGKKLERTQVGKPIVPARKAPGEVGA